MLSALPKSFGRRTPKRVPYDHMSTFGTTFSSQRNPLVTRTGAAVFLALALGLLLLQGPGRALGYGTTPPACTGYHVVCKAQVSGLRTVPISPRVGAGFTASFKTTSGGEYTLKAVRKGARTKLLSHGVIGSGSVSLKRLGKKLNSGKYTLVVSIKSGQTTDRDTQAITIRKAA